MGPGDDFSTNRHSVLTSSKLATFETAIRHPNLCFNDGNIAILTDSYYFLVHKGLICRHSPVLESLTSSLDSVSLVQYLEKQPVLHLQDSPDDMFLFLLALYDGITSVTHDKSGFATVSVLLRLATKYEVVYLRNELLRGLSAVWPLTLAQWDAREDIVTNRDGVYAPRQDLPHPILVISLGRTVNAPELLPSAFYDLSRCSPSDISSGYTSQDGSKIHLSELDLLNLLKGREHGSRFLSTFIVNELEGREPASTCLYRNAEDVTRQRTCQVAFEAITFELLRDINGLICNRSSDPLFAILDSEVMQTRQNSPESDSFNPFRACENCRMEYGAVIDVVRAQFWQKLPCWFGMEVSTL